MNVRLVSLPGNTDVDRRQLVVDWWNGLRVGDDSGATTWEVLDALEREVTECLAGIPPDIPKAESLTAKAAILMTGNMVP